MTEEAFMKLATTTIGAVMASMFSLPAAAVDFNVKVENLTRGILFTPLLVVAHPDTKSYFTLGSAASTELMTLAEGGGLPADAALTTATYTHSNNPKGGMLGPGESTDTDLNTDSATANTHLTVMAMMLPTNDGFVALNGIDIPTTAGTYTYYANAYDAGSEANNELVGSGTVGMAGFPVPAPAATAISAGSGGTGVPGVSAEGQVHIHRGVLGDTNATGGISDIKSERHRWLNPVAKITLTVK